MHILVVEDEVRLAETLGEILKGQNTPAILFLTGVTALTMRKAVSMTSYFLTSCSPR